MAECASYINDAFAVYTYRRRLTADICCRQTRGIDAWTQRRQPQMQRSTFGSHSVVAASARVEATWLIQRDFRRP